MNCTSFLANLPGSKQLVDVFEGIDRFVHGLSLETIINQTCNIFAEAN